MVAPLKLAPLNSEGSVNKQNPISTERALIIGTSIFIISSLAAFALGFYLTEPRIMETKPLEVERYREKGLVDQLCKNVFVNCKNSLEQQCRSLTESCLKIEVRDTLTDFCKSNLKERGLNKSEEDTGIFSNMFLSYWEGDKVAKCVVNPAGKYKAHCSKFFANGFIMQQVPANITNYFSNKFKEFSIPIRVNWDQLNLKIDIR